MSIKPSPSKPDAEQTQETSCRSKQKYKFYCFLFTKTTLKTQEKFKNLISLKLCPSKEDDKTLKKTLKFCSTNPQKTPE